MENFVQNYVNGSDRESAIKNITSIVIETGDGILALIENLQALLTDTDIVKRCTGCEIIRDTLEKLPENGLNGKQSSVIAEFLTNRLKDHYSLHAPVLSAMVTITGYTNLPEGTMTNILYNIFREVHMQSCMHSDRKNVLTIVSNAMENYQKEVLKMGRDFIFNFIQVVDGEQDPRNLILVFQLAFDVINYGLDISPLAEELFEVIGCYFPIDFEPPSNIAKDKAVITNEQLVSGLRKVLSASSLFAPFCIPLLIEKLNSNLQSAKKDSILTLHACLKVYSVKDLKPHLTTIWNALRRETMYASSEEIESSSLKLVTALVKTIASEITQPGSINTELDSFMKQVKSDCLDRLNEPLQEKLIWSSSKLLIACGEASKGSCMRIFNEMIPVILTQLNKEETVIADKRLAMEILVHILKVCSVFSFDKHIVFHPVHSHKEKILQELYKAINENNHIMLRTIALAGLVGMCKLGKVLDEEDLQTMVGNIFLVLKSDNNKDILQDVHTSLGYIATISPKIIEDKIIIPLISEVQLNQDSSGEHLNCIAAVCTNLSTISNACTSVLNIATSETLNEYNFKFVLDCLTCIETIVTGNSTTPSHVEYFVDNLVQPLIKFSIEISLMSTLPQQCCSNCIQQENFSSNCITWPIMQSIAKTLQKISQNVQPGDSSDSLILLMTNIFINNNLKCLNIELGNRHFSPFKNIDSPLQSRLICLLTSTLCSLRQQFDVGNINCLLSQLLLVCNTSPDQLSYVASAKCLAGMLNKQTETCGDIINKILEMGQVLPNSKASMESKIRSFTCFMWTTKALALRSHDKLKDFVDTMLQMFSSDMGEMAADSFDIILRNTDEVLNKSCHAKIRLMYKQRFFQMTLSSIVDGFNTAKKENSDATKSNYLRALSHMLKYVPKQVLQQNFEVLFPLLVNALNGGNPVLLQSVLSTLYCLIEEAKTSIEMHIDTLLKHFLRLMKASQMSVRIQALKCLGVTTLLPSYTLLPHKKTIVRELSSALDDKKRLVRQEAVKARSEWCLVGEA